MQDCYAKDEMAVHFEDAMLRTGVVPEVGMHLYLQVSEALTNSR